MWLPLQFQQALSLRRHRQLLLARRLFLRLDLPSSSSSSSSSNHLTILTRSPSINNQTIVLKNITSTTSITMSPAITSRLMLPPPPAGLAVPPPFRRRLLLSLLRCGCLWLRLCSQLVKCIRVSPLLLLLLLLLLLPSTSPMIAMRNPFSLRRRPPLFGMYGDYSRCGIL